MASFRDIPRDIKDEKDMESFHRALREKAVSITSHNELKDIKEVDKSSTDTTKNRHVSDYDMKKIEDHMDDTSKHLERTLPGDANYIGTITPGSSMIASSVSGTTATIDVVPGNINHNALSNLTTGDPHTQYLQTTEASADTFSSPGASGTAVTMTKVGVDFQFKKINTRYGINTNGSSSDTVMVGIDQQVYRASATLTSAAAATPVSFIDNSEVTGRKCYLISFVGKVNGATAWTAGTMTQILIRDKNNNTFFSIPLANLLANQVLLMDLATGTFNDRLTLGTGSDTGYGLEIVADGTAAGGSNLVMNLFLILA